MKNEFHRTKFYKPELLRKDEDIRKISFCTETGQKVSKAVNQQGSKPASQQGHPKISYIQKFQISLSKYRIMYYVIQYLKYMLDHTKFKIVRIGKEQS